MRIFNTRGEAALFIAIIIVACLAAFLSIRLTFAQPYPDARLGGDWQCTRTAGVLTVCARGQS